MKKISVSLVAMLCFLMMGFTQTENFEPGGKPFMNIFTNFHSTFSDGKTNSAFEIDRVYLGYEYTFSKNFSAKANIDIGDPGVGTLQMTAYLKNAFLKYQTNKFAANFGLISTNQFSVQENFWGYRYIEKSFQDAYKFNSSADLGISAAYKFNAVLSADMIIANGEGYKNLQNDSVFRTGFGLTIKPLKNLTTRIYYDYSTKENTQSSIAAFVGYAASNFSLGVEYNKMLNSDFEESHDLSGTSVYVTLKASKKLNLFARFDQLMSNTISGDLNDWNIAKDGQLYIVGMEYTAVKGVKLAPNFKGWNPADPNSKFVSTFYLNCEIKF